MDNTETGLGDLTSANNSQSGRLKNVTMLGFLSRD